jgi:hypothetical protein
MEATGSLKTPATTYSTTERKNTKITTLNCKCKHQQQIRKKRRKTKTKPSPQILVSYCPLKPMWKGGYFGPIESGLFFL